VKAHSPAFQFYPKDWFSDSNVRSMSYEEKGIYIDLILTCWIDGTIPADEDEILNLLHLQQGHRGMPGFPDPWNLQDILRCFEPAPDDPGRLIHPRLEREREVQRLFQDGRKRASKARWSKNSSGHPDECSSSSSSSSSVPEERNLPSFHGSGTAVPKGQRMDGTAGCEGGTKDRRAEIGRLTRKVATRKKQR